MTNWCHLQYDATATAACGSAAGRLSFLALIIVGVRDPPISSGLASAPTGVRSTYSKEIKDLSS